MSRLRILRIIARQSGGSELLALRRDQQRKLKKEETKNGEEADRSGRIEEDDYRMSLGL
jgi:hypothetical protein